MTQKEMTAPPPVDVVEGELAETPPAPDLTVLAEQPAPVDEKKQEEVKPQELAETSPASVGLVVTLVVVSIVVAVVLAMWMVSPLLALLLGAGLIVVAVLAAAGWLGWRRFTRRHRRADTTGDRAARSTGPGGSRDRKSRDKANGDRSWWPFGRKNTDGPTSRNSKNTTGGGGRDKGGKPTSGSRSNGGGGGGSWWPFGRKNTDGSTSRKDTTGGGGGRDKKKRDKSAGGKPNGDRSPSLWPFGRKNTDGSTSRKDTTGGGGGRDKGAGGGRDKNGGGKAVGRDSGSGRPRSGRTVLGLLRLASAVKKNSTNSKNAKDSGKDGGKDGADARSESGRVRPTPGGHRPETVIDVDLDDIVDPPRRTTSGPASGHQAAPPPPRPGPAGGGDRWWKPRSSAYQVHNEPFVSHIDQGGPVTTTTSTTTDVDQEAMRVANRYAGLILKAETLQGRAGACRDAADQYRRDARANQESAENHKMAARTIRDVNVSAEHARAAREAEAEAAREILAARYYEEQAEEYEAQARAIGF
jgi:hypothetical protein